MLYTPSGYDPARDGPLPTVLWAYPREFKSSASASQARSPAQKRRPPRHPWSHCPRCAEAGEARGGDGRR